MQNLPKGAVCCAKPTAVRGFNGKKKAPKSVDENGRFCARRKGVAQDPSSADQPSTSVDL
jgi:hypothetical protein